MKNSNGSNVKKKSFVKSIGKFLIAIILVLLILFAAIRFIYPTILRSQHKISEPGIDLEEMVDIGGIKQSIYFRGENKDNPVILFLHGGPGSPETAFLHTFQYELEEDYTIVQWEQRNSGKTYYANNPEEVLKTLSFDTVLNDAWEVSQYVMDKLDKEKIIVLGHSWGTVLGTALVQTHPDSFSAYISVGQVVNMNENESVGYEKVLEAARNAGNEKDIKAIEALAPYPAANYTVDFNKTIMKLRGYQAKYKLAVGMTYDVMLQALTSPYYTMKELMYFLNVDVLYYQEPIMNYLFNEYDAHNFGTEYSMPVFYIMGENDFQTPITISEKFFSEIKAPVSKFFSVPDAGHVTMTDNTEEFTRIMLEEIKPYIN